MDFSMHNIYKRKTYEEMVNKIIATGNTKKPTEIIIFTDGNDFSCESVFIKGLQVYGFAIVVGYNIKIPMKFKKFLVDEISDIHSSHIRSGFNTDPQTIWVQRSDSCKTRHRG